MSVQKRAILLCAVLSWKFASTLAGDPVRETFPSVLTNAQQVRALTVPEARRRLPVRMRGVVTYVDLDWRMLFVQDSTTGAYVLGFDPRKHLATGDLVEVTGISQPGAYSPFISEASVKVLGPGDLPDPRVSSIDGLADGKADGLWVEVSGVVGSAAMEDGRLVLNLFENKDWLRVTVLSATPDWRELVNARVRVRGVCTASADDDRNLTGVDLFVPSEANVIVVEPAPKDAFVLPIQTVADALQGTSGPTRIQGAIQTNAVNGSVWLRDGTGGVRLDALRTNELKPGLILDVVGSLARIDGEPAFREAASRRIGILGTNEVWNGWLDSSERAGTNRLMSIEQIRWLKAEDAARPNPVRIRCVVTYYDPDWGTAFVQDPTGGIFVNAGGAVLDLKVGDRVELEGMTEQGDYAPIITRPRFKPLGLAPLPRAGRYSLRELMSGSQDSQWLSVEGVVQSVKTEWGHATLDVAEPGGRFQVLIPNSWDPSALDHLVDAKVRLEGVCGTIFNQKRQLIGVRLFVPGLDFVKTERGAPEDPFSLPLRTIGSLLQFTAGDEPDHRVRIRGTVTLSRPRQFVFLQDDSGGIMVRSDDAPEALNPGDEIEVAGFPVAGNYTPVLDHAIWRKVGSGTQARSMPVTAEQALSADHKEIFDARIVRLRGRLLDMNAGSKERVFVLQDGPAIFNASLEGAETNRLSSAIRVGSVLELTGVCSVRLDSTHSPKSLQLLLRSPSDIRVVQSPSWWTMRHTLWALAGLSAVVFASLGWVGSLRKQVRQGTRELREEIAERKRTEEELRESKALYHSLVEHLPINVYRKDREGRYLFVNSRFCQFRGKTSDQVLGKTLLDVVPEELAEQFAEQDRVVMETGRPLELDEVCDIQGGKAMYFHLVKSPVFDSEGKIVGTQGMFFDITARKQAEAELAYERDLLRTFLEKSPDHIYFKDLNSRFLRCSQTLAERCGLTSMDEIVGKCDFDFFAEEHARPAFEDEQEVIRTGRPIVGKVEKEFWKESGKMAWVLTTKVPLRDKTGQIVGTFGVSKDITAIKEGELRLEEAHKQLLQASRLAGMAEVASGVLHNVGNVLNSVNVSATLVAESLRKSKAARLARVAALLREHSADLGTFITVDPKGKQLPGYLSQLSEHLAAEQETMVKELCLLRNNIEHIKEIVAMQQNYAKVSGVAEVVRVADLVEDALRMNGGSLIRHEVTVARDIEPHPPEITVDRHKVLQILVNLIRNAKHACDESERTDKQLTVRVSNGDDRVRIAVTDNGVGIPFENLTRIFNHGFTTKKDGHGFGLHSAALAAREMGGALRVHSGGPGLGATFTLELPLTHD
ncbi:MAG TPA: PAS domain-containing protein [Verrucomicrobiae bacterium]|nr:PAS domain-containing protein [Verrucomicrobiae bacterium]